MIRYTHFRFFFCKMKTGYTENIHMLYIPSFCFSFSDSIKENKNRVIKFPFPFSYFKTKKGI